METKEFKKGDNVFFLKKGRNVISILTDETTDGCQFYFVSDGTIVNINNSEYTIEREECGIITVPSNLAFDSYEKAKAKAKELNNESLSELEEVVKSIKGYYPL
jgi:hypothetical protein